MVPVASLAAVVTTTGPNPQSLTTIDGTLYWSESGEDPVKSASVTGGTATVLATKMVNPDVLDFSGTDVIWLDERPFTGNLDTCYPFVNDNRVLKRSPLDNLGLTTVSVTGGSPTTLTSTSFAVDSTDVYYTDAGLLDIRKIAK